MTNSTSPSGGVPTSGPAMKQRHSLSLSTDSQDASGTQQQDQTITKNPALVPTNRPPTILEDFLDWISYPVNIAMVIWFAVTIAVSVLVIWEHHYVFHKKAQVYPRVIQPEHLPPEWRDYDRENE